MTGQIVGYKRVSSTSQSLDRQELPDVTGRIFEEKLTGAKRDRPALQEMLGYVRDGDEVHVHSIDRLARNLKDLEDIVSEIIGKGSSIKFIKEGLHFKPDQETDPFQKLMFQMLGSFAEFERSIIRSRQAEGIKKAKEEGKYLGRRPKINPDCVVYLYFMHVKADDIADWMGIGRASVFRILKKMDDENTTMGLPMQVKYVEVLRDALESGLKGQDVYKYDDETAFLEEFEDTKKWSDKLLKEYPSAKAMTEYYEYLVESQNYAENIYHMNSRAEFSDERIDWLIKNNHSPEVMAERTGLPEAAITAIIKDRQNK